ncbi:MAG: hypothetical protein HXY19_03210 [Thermoanaerobaculaceae bacterium]|nr:hypothetical protein [Thermoanaerobaculaceae bacterium]
MGTLGRSTVVGALALVVAGAAGAVANRGFGVAVLVDGVARPEYWHQGTVYVEAVKGEEYTIRLTNPLGRRVAVALSVDGLNTIDARHTDARRAAKWVMEPWGRLEISGWQVSGREARRFFFTTERASYGAWLGETANLGVIEAVFFAEREREVCQQLPRPVQERQVGKVRQRAPTEEPAARGEEQQKLLQDYAATGVGERLEHRVERVWLDLEQEPVAVVRIRYEFRPQLEALGVVPSADSQGALGRRERARGFEGWYCPDPGRP